MEQRIIIDNPKGRIGVNGDDFTCALQVDGEFIGAYWPDCAGSIGQCIWLSEMGCNRGHSAWESIINYGELQDGTLAEIFKPVTNSLVNGVYNLILDEEEFDWEIMRPVKTMKRLNGYYKALYPWPLQLISTLDIEQIDTDRITYFQNIIRNHGRPIAITLSNENSYCSYILDGHHKLEAYKRENIQPRVLFIESLDSSLDIDVESSIANETVLREFRRLDSRAKNRMKM